MKPEPEETLDEPSSKSMVMLTAVGISSSTKEVKSGRG